MSEGSCMAKDPITQLSNSKSDTTEIRYHFQTPLLCTHCAYFQEQTLTWLIRRKGTFYFPELVLMPELCLAFGSNVVTFYSVLFLLPFILENCKLFYFYKNCL